MRHRNLTELKLDKEKGRLQSPLMNSIMEQIEIAFCDEQDSVEILKFTKLDMNTLIKMGYSVEIVKISGSFISSHSTEKRMLIKLK